MVVSEILWQNCILPLQGSWVLLTDKYNNSIQASEIVIIPMVSFFLRLESALPLPPPKVLFMFQP